MKGNRREETNEDMATDGSISIRLQSQINEMKSLMRKIEYENINLREERESYLDKIKNLE